MKLTKDIIHQKRSGTALILSMIFVLIFSALAISMATMSGTNVQLVSNQHKVNSALSAALSGLDCGRYIINTVTLDETGHNYVTEPEANTVWTRLCQRLQNAALDGQIVASANLFTDTLGSGDQIETASMNFGSPNVEFAIRFYRYDSNHLTIKLQSTGSDDQVSKTITMDMQITKDRQVLSYAIASRGRMWLTGDTTIHGDVFSSWHRPEISPYNMTSDSRVEGTINTVLTRQQIQANHYQLETLDENGNPMFDEEGNRIYSPQDEIKAYHQGINYGQPYEDIPGMDISDYNTDMYKTGLTTIPSCPTSQRKVEYFPHAAGNYALPRDSSSVSFTRHVYQNQTLTNALLPLNRHALFKNCTFEGELYIDCSKTSTSSKSYCNNVRFENCTFNGTMITNVPQPFNWRYNCLYFTGAATFNTQTGIQEATILAPHFNVNLGNTNPQQNDNNVLTGAIVGGIVDVRGNAQIYGTIISMADTTAYSSGYVTNIGATLDDGGSETTELGDIGVIAITPEEDKMLPSGITSPIVIMPLQNTYSECL
ncbi:MAG: pilus assembly PilX N-terminal domain-containing protein [Sedimentisphaerales bacterium]|nr:pilus assembly PilX N-terminal domain-containing protein [Sedimentisphaerales bacterium]